MAIKIVLAEDDTSSSQIVNRALQEARVCWSLNHPNVVRVFDYGRTDDGSAFIVMERLEGETLARRLEQRKKLDLPMVLAVARQIATGLDAIHARGAVHRDVKPENIFLCSTGVVPDQVKLLDLGIAALPSDDPARVVQTAQGAVFGTPGYMAPEQALGAGVDCRADLYGVGATVFACLTGDVPHKGNSALDTVCRSAYAKAPPPLPDDLPEALAHLLNKCLDPDPLRRPDNVSAFLEILDEVMTVDTRADTQTTISRGNRVVEAGSLRLPTLGNALDHARFRTQIVFAIRSLFGLTNPPPALKALLDETTRLFIARKEATERAGVSRRAADAEAKALHERDKLLQRAMAEVEKNRQQTENSLLTMQSKLARLEARIGDHDRDYVDCYRRIETLQANEVEIALERGVPTTLEGLFGQQVQALLDEMESIQARRARAFSAQSDRRAEIRTVQLAARDLAIQSCELRRSLLKVETEREAKLVVTEDEARRAEDAVLQMERVLEHHFLRLGVALKVEVLLS